MNPLNRLHHWQIFGALLIVPIVVSVIDVPEPTPLKHISNLVAFLLYCAWLISLNQAGSGSVVTRYMTIVCIFVLFAIFGLVTLRIMDGDLPSVLAFFTFFSLHIIVSVLIGKRLTSAGAEMGFKKPFVNPFWIYLFPVGVWFVQPMVNELVKGRGKGKNE